MTKVAPLKYKCPNCGENYTATTYFSNYSKLPRPKIPEPICPKCSTPYYSKK